MPNAPGKRCYSIGSVDSTGQARIPTAGCSFCIMVPRHPVTGHAARSHIAVLGSAYNLCAMVSWVLENWDTGRPPCPATDPAPLVPIFALVVPTCFACGNWYVYESEPAQAFLGQCRFTSEADNPTFLAMTAIKPRRTVSGKIRTRTVPVLKEPMLRSGCRCMPVDPTLGPVAGSRRAIGRIVLGKGSSRVGGLQPAPIAP